MAVLDGQAMRDDIVSRLLGGEPDLATSKYLDRISELASMGIREKIEQPAGVAEVKSNGIAGL